MQCLFFISIYQQTKWLQAILVSDFKQCLLIGFLWSMTISLSFIGHSIPSCVWHIKTYTHMFYQLFFPTKANKGRLLYVYLCLINQELVICSYTVKPAYTTTSIPQSLVEDDHLSNTTSNHFFCPPNEKKLV